MAHTVRFRRQSQTDFVKSFRALSDRHSSWEVWADFINLVAITIFSPFGDRKDRKHQEREQEYQRIIQRYTERPAYLVAEIDRRIKLSGFY